MEPCAYAYFLRCADDSLYGGWTVDMTERLKAHNGKSKQQKGAKYTRTRRPVRLALRIDCSHKVVAQRFEFHMKKLTRPYKLALLAGNKKVWDKLYTLCVEQEEGEEAVIGFAQAFSK